MIDRLKQMIEYYGLNTSQFEKKIFSSNGSIRTVLNRGSGLNVSTVTRILENCPEISPDWLLLGKGEMLRQNVPQNANQGTFSADNAMCEKIIADLRSELAATYRTIGQLEYRLQQEGEKANSPSAPTPMEPTLV